VVHGKVRSLSASPSISRPVLPSVLTFPPMPQLFDKKHQTVEPNDPL
jgi:hypothetical protein